LRSVGSTHRCTSSRSTRFGTPTARGARRIEIPLEAICDGHAAQRNDLP
jgi:hypothetical protein